MRDAYVIGVGATPYGKLDTTLRESACQAALDAIDMAGLPAEKIDGGFVANALGMAERQGHLGPLVMTSLGIPDKPMSSIEAACASGASAFREAFVNVAGGFADCYLAVGVEKVSSIDSITATSYFAYASDYVYEGNCGASFPGLYATIARAHMRKFGTTEEDMARVAVQNHENALLNPKAHLKKKITVEDVMKSTMVSSPLKMFDACPFSDGASAALVATREVAERLGVPLVRVAGVGRAGSRAALPDRTDLTSLTGTKLAAKEALGNAKLGIDKVDFFELHQQITGMVGGPRQLRGVKRGLAHNVGATGGSVAVTVLEGLN